MDNLKRKRFQGVTNIIRFNWHFYAIAMVAAVLLLTASQFVSPDIKLFVTDSILVGIVLVFLSLSVSFYVYDCSPLYTLDWLGSLPITERSALVNINAGFDETSFLLSRKYPGAELHVFDF